MSVLKVAALIHMLYVCRTLVVITERDNKYAWTTAQQAMGTSVERIEAMMTTDHGSLSYTSPFHLAE